MATAENVFPKEGGDPPYASEYNGFIRRGVWYNRVENSDYDDTNDIMIMLSRTRWIAFDDSAKELLLTVDSGGSWIAQETGLTDTLDNFYVNSNDPNYITFYSETQGEEAWFSADGGGSWTAITAQADADQDYWAYSIADSGRLYVIQSNGGIGELWYSDNGGTGWTQVTGHQSFNPGDPDENYIASPKDDIVVYQSKTGAGASDIGYTLNGGGAWVESGEATGTNVKIKVAIYIDSDNYCINATDKDASNTGFHIVVFNGDTISSSSTVEWSTTLVLLTTSKIIYNAEGAAFTQEINSTGEKYIYDSTLVFTYHGVSYIANEYRNFSDVLFTISPEQKIYNSINT